MINAIILAGMQTIKDSGNNTNKAMLRINDKMMIEYVIDAARQASEIDKIVVIGPKDELESKIGTAVNGVIQSTERILDNVLIGVKYLGIDKDVLVMTSDIPLITAESINDFIAEAQNTGADYCYPIIKREVNQKKYPEADRTYVKVKEGHFTGGNIFYVNPKVVENGGAIVKKILDARKNPIRMAWFFGFGFMMKLITGILSISGAEKRFSDILRINAKAIISNYPEIGNDVDKPSDIVVVTAHLSK